jgi:glycosyltransferase involved in cell wall biosynthesis
VLATSNVNRTERRRVLFLIPSLRGGGAERVFSTLLRHLDRSCFELHLAVLQGQGSFSEEIPPDVVVHDLNVSRVRYALPAIVRLVWQTRPDMLLSTLGHLNLALIVAKPLMPHGTKILIRETTITATFLQEGTRHPRLWRWVYRRFYKRADKVVCLSDSMMDDLAVNFSVPREKLVRIYNPIDMERIWAMAKSGANTAHGPGPHLVNVGRLSVEKGLDVLLDAMPTILKHLPDAQLTVLGEGPLLTDLLEQAKRLGLSNRVHFLGFQKNPWSYISHSDLFILPSRFEGLPNAVLEALALGTRVVASDCPGAMRELQDHDARIILAPPGDPTALAELIISACKSPAQKFKYREPPKSILTKFDLHQIMSEYSKLLLS